MALASRASLWTTRRHRGAQAGARSRPPSCGRRACASAVLVMLTGDLTTPPTDAREGRR